MFGRKRKRPQLYASIQTRDATPIGAMGTAFYTPWRCPVAVTGTGINAGSYTQEGGAQLMQAQGVQLVGLGGLVTGTYAHQPLSPADYVLGRGL